MNTLENCLAMMMRPEIDDAAVGNDGLEILQSEVKGNEGHEVRKGDGVTIEML